MSVCAVICEYNPFHFGHEYLISRMRSHDENACVIAVMSGEFTQRGESALITKYERAYCAVKGGADLVLELPFPYCSAGVEGFSFGGISLIKSLNCVDTLFFGSEAGDAEALGKTAENLLSDEFNTELSSLSHDIPYFEAYKRAYEKLYGKSVVLSASNDILACGYLTAVKKLDCKIKPLAFKRVGNVYNGRGEGFSSSTYIRECISKGELNAAFTEVPEYSANALRDAYEKGELSSYERLFGIFCAFLRLSKPGDIARYAECGEELASRLILAAKKSTCMDELLAAARTKKYSLSRIKRAMLFSLLGITRERINAPVSYTNVLAFNEKGKALLGKMRKTAGIPIITKPSDYKLKGDTVINDAKAALDAEALWTLSTGKTLDAGFNYRKSPVII